MVDYFDRLLRPVKTASELTSAGDPGPIEFSGASHRVALNWAPICPPQRCSKLLAAAVLDLWLQALVSAASKPLDDSQLHRALVLEPA